MAAVDVNLAEAVKDELNATTFSATFTAQRTPIIDFNLTDVDNLHVYVVSSEINIEGDSRAEQSWEYAIQIGIVKRLQITNDPTEINAIVDPLKLLVEEVLQHMLANRRLSALSSAILISAKNTQPYTEKWLREKHLFFSLLTLTYRVYQ